MAEINTDAIIIGAGIAGLTTAGLLSRAGLNCVVIEAAEKSNGQSSSVDPRALALTRASCQILTALGAWQQLSPERIGVFKSMQVWDENGQGQVCFDSAELNQRCLGYIVEQAYLQKVLSQTVSQRADISWRYGTKMTGLETGTDYVQVSLSNDDLVRAPVLIAADGSRSLTRDTAGIGWKTKDYHQTAIACVVRTALAHGNVARQRFLSQGPLAFLPMSDNFQCGVVWSTSPESATQLLLLEEAEFNRALQEAFDNTLGDITRSLERASYPLIRAEASEYARDRVVLIGDAAHSVHPLAGQGANLALLDAATLVQLMEKAHSVKKDTGSKRVLRAYERWRKGENKSIMMILESFKYTFENQRQPVPLLRNAALDFANAVTPLKQTIMRHAMGLSGDLPEVAKSSYL